MPKPSSKSKVMLTPDKDDWRLLKIHAAANGFNSTQELVYHILKEWLFVHPLNLSALIDNNNTIEKGGE